MRSLGRSRRREEGATVGMTDKNRRADGSALPFVRDQALKHN